MNNSFFVFSDNDSLAQYLNSAEFKSNTENASSILFQIFTSQTDEKVLHSIVDIIKKDSPTSVILGSTTVGGILEDAPYSGSTIISVSVFENTTLNPIIINCNPGSEYAAGYDLIKTINKQSNIAGVMLFSTPMTLDVSAIFKGMSTEYFSFPVFGGGTGAYNSADHSIIFCENDFYNQGLIALLFISKDLQIYTDTFLGWNSLGKEMTITETDGLILKKIDDISAFHIYKKYLNLQKDNNLFKNVLQFPFLLNRNGHTVVRSPYYVDENGYLRFLADIEEGEKLHIGYADPSYIVHELKSIHDELAEFGPDAIFLFVCICRLYLQEKHIELETKPFNSIAPTVGYYTYGEFCSYGNNVLHQNSAIVVVGMREGEKKRKLNKTSKSTSNQFSHDSKQGVVSKLVHFIKTVSTELEQTSKELTRISGLDKLTQVFSKSKLENILKSEIIRSRRYHTRFSLILLEADNFEELSEKMGHLASDKILVQISRTLKNNLRGTDSLGRLESSKFLIILPETDLEQASLAAEKIKVILGSTDFADDMLITYSMGLTTFYDSDDYETILVRVSNALKTAKVSGASKIVSAKLSQSKTL